MSRSPNVPRHPTNPVGQSKRLLKVRRAINADIREAQQLAVQTIQSWPYQVQNGRMRTNAFYEFLIDLSTLTTLVDRLVDIMRNGRSTKAAREASEAAYREGVGKTSANLAGLTSDYPRTVAQRLSDPQVLRWATIAGARTFEQMQGFAGEAGKGLARILYNAVQGGENPRQTTKRIMEEFGVARYRAERIARTEITGALRRGRWDETRTAQEKFGMEVRLIHYSALIAGRTRKSHARRHGMIVTVQEQAEWYAQNANAINCLCSQTEVTIGKDGEPLFGKKLLGRMEKAREAFLQLEGGI